MGERIWIADAHRDYGKRSIVPADEKLTAFLELERAIYHALKMPCSRNFRSSDPTPFPDQKWVRLCFSNKNAIAAQSVVIATIRFDESGQPPNVVWV